MALWYDEVWQDRVRLGVKVARVLFSRRSEHQQIDVLETPHYGRTLVIDGVFMTSERDEHYYHEMMVHPALVTAPRIARVLIIGGGDGGTAREVLRYPGVESVTLVEIDDVVVDACRQHLPSLGAWDDPRLHVRILDGIDFVGAAQAGSFDVVLLDGTDPVGPGEGLFASAFYRSVRRLLAPGGVFALQSESPILTPDMFTDIVGALREVFPVASPYFGPAPIYAAGNWSWTYCTDSADPARIDAERIDAIEPGCRYYNRDIHRAAFTRSNAVARLLERRPV